jgi:hypothetical protein
MNDFVNPQHRGVNLPPGYKDLMDVLERKKTPTDSEPRSPVFEHFETDGLSQVEKFLDLLLNSKSERSFLGFFRKGSCSPFAISRSGSQLNAIFSLGMGELVCERTLREAFAEAGIIPDLEAHNPVYGHHFFSYPLRLSQPELLALVLNVLRRAYGISDRDGLGLIFGEP